MRPEILIAAKDLKLLMRDRAAAFFTFMFPLAVAFFFGFIFGGGDEQPMQVAAWNAGNGPASVAFIKALEEDDAFTLIVAKSRDEGLALVRSEKVVGLIAVPAEFDERSQSVFAGGGPAVELIMDPSRKAEGGLITGKLAQISFQTMFQSMTDPSRVDGMIKQMEQSLEMSGLPKDYQRSFSDALSRMPALANLGSAGAASDGSNAGEASTNPMRDWMPLRIESSTLTREKHAEPTNMFAISFLQGIAWGLFGAVLSFTGSMVEERERGTLMRLLAAPIRPLQVLFGKALACLVACVCVEIMLVSVGVFVCGVVVSSIPLFLAATLCTAFAFTGIMMVLSACFRTQGGAQGAGRGALLVLAMIGGGTVPLFFMPKAVQVASSISPFKWAIAAAEGATWRALTPLEMLPSLSVLLGIGVVCTAIAAAAMRRRLV